MKGQTITAIFHYCNSDRKEVKTVNCLFDEKAEQYELTKVFVVELGKKLVFSKLDNTFLVND
jgi:hypothetical protein